MLEETTLTLGGGRGVFRATSSRTHCGRKTQVRRLGSEAKPPKIPRIYLNYPMQTIKTRK